MSPDYIGIQLIIYHACSKKAIRNYKYRAGYVKCAKPAEDAFRTVVDLVPAELEQLQKATIN